MARRQRSRSINASTLASPAKVPRLETSIGSRELTRPYTRLQARLENSGSHVSSLHPSRDSSNCQEATVEGILAVPTASSRSTTDVYARDKRPVREPSRREHVERPFRLMDLPTEIRLEIYRACLTRPRNILLSKKKPPEPEATEEGDELLDEVVPRRTSISSNRDSDEFMEGLLAESTRHPRRQSASLGTRSRQHADGGPSTRPTVARRRTSLDEIGSESLGSASRLPRSTRDTRVLDNTSQRASVAPSFMSDEPEEEEEEEEDCLVPNILRTSWTVFKEARGILYGENIFSLELSTAQSALSSLHQKCRRHIKHVELEIPSFNEILERFQETVRLQLRYCSGLKKFVVRMPFTLPGTDGGGGGGGGGSAATSNSIVYANGFDILRWLPQKCDVVLQGKICAEISTVVNKHLLLARTLDKHAYAHRQLIANDAGGSGFYC